MAENMQQHFLHQHVNLTALSTNNNLKAVNSNNSKNTHTHISLHGFQNICGGYFVRTNRMMHSTMLFIFILY